MALQAYKRGPPSQVYMLQHSLQHVSYDDIVVVRKHAIRIFDDFQFSLFDFPHHLSSFNACEELDHLIILYPPVPRTHEYWGGGHCPLQLLWWRRPCLECLTYDIFSLHQRIIVIRRSKSNV